MFSVLDFTFLHFWCNLPPSVSGGPACQPGGAVHPTQVQEGGENRPGLQIPDFPPKGHFHFLLFFWETNFSGPELCVGPKISHPEHHCLDGGSDRGSAPVCIQQPLFGRKFFNCKLSVVLTVSCLFGNPLSNEYLSPNVGHRGWVASTLTRGGQ